MFGLGKILGGLVGGLLDKVGLGALTPFVKMGLDAMTGNWLGVAEDVFGMVSQFKGDPTKNASQRPPLGGFENQFTNNTNPLTKNKVGGFLSSLKNLFSGIKSLMSGDFAGSFGKIFNAFTEISKSFDNNELFSQRSNTARMSGMA